MCIVFVMHGIENEFQIGAKKKVDATVRQGPQKKTLRGRICQGSAWIPDKFPKRYLKGTLVTTSEEAGKTGFKQLDQGLSE